MKHAHIGLVALAAVLVAGCGGGSDNGGGSSSFDVEDLTRELRSALVAVEGQTYTIAAGKTHEVDVEGGQIVFSGCPDGCSVTVSRSNGQVVVTGSVDDVEVEFKRTPTPQPPTVTTRPTTPTTPTTETNTALEQERERNRRLQEQLNEANQRANSAQDGPRAERLVGVLAALAGSNSDNNHYRTATVQHERPPSRQNIDVGTLDSKPASLAGWTTGKEFFQSATATHGHKAYLYTDLDDPKARGAQREYWKVYADATPEVTVTAGTNAPTVSDTDEAASIRITGSPIPYKIDGTRASSSPTFAGEFATLEIGASFGGTPGKLVCSDGCGGTTAGDGDDVDDYFKRTNGKPNFGTAAADGTWTFQSTDLKAFHDRDHDETYLYFGYWMNMPEELTGTPGFEWIRGGSSGDLDGVIITAAGLEGTAKYTGSATGQYAINTLAETSFGPFTATVNLNADFGEASNSDGNTLSGSIRNFQAPDSSSAGTWVLYLRGAGSASHAALTGSATGTIQLRDSSTETNPLSDSKIGGVSVSGDWGATLHGVDNAGAANKPDGVTCPNGCAADVAGFAGWFRAAGNNVAGDNVEAVNIGAPAIVSIAGAFAAK